jgi:hypothetical protein
MNQKRNSQQTQYPELLSHTSSSLVVIGIQARDNAQAAASPLDSVLHLGLDGGDFVLSSSILLSGYMEVSEMRLV